MPQSGEDPSAATDGAANSEDTKRKFRAALEKKNAKHHATVEATQGAKINSSHAAAATKREFRRKSG